MLFFSEIMVQSSDHERGVYSVAWRWYVTAGKPGRSDFVPGIACLDSTNGKARRWWAGTSGWVNLTKGEEILPSIIAASPHCADGPGKLGPTIQSHPQNN